MGLCSHLREAVWLGDVDVDTFFPRCYQLNSEEDRECFIGVSWSWLDSATASCSSHCMLSAEDYRRTAALSILKAVTEGGGVLTAMPPVEGRPVVPEEAVTLALRAARVFLNSLEHEDIESSSTWLVCGREGVCWCLEGGVCADNSVLVCECTALLPLPPPHTGAAPGCAGVGSTARPLLHHGLVSPPHSGWLPAPPHTPMQRCDSACVWSEVQLPSL